MEKQIKEMAEDVAQAICKTEDCAECKYEYCSLEYAIADKLFNKGYRLQKTTYMLKTDGTLEMIPTVESVRQTTAKEIIDFANEVIEFFENDATVDDEHKVYFKLAMRFFQTKIMERYGV